MAAAVCGVCAELFEGGRACPRCGRPLARGRDAVLAWERARQRTRIETWVAAGVIDRATAERLFAEIEGAAASGRAPASEHAADANGSSLEARADGFFAATSELYREVSARWTRVVRAIEDDAPPSSRDHEDDEDRQRDGAHLEAGRAAFARAGDPVVGAGVEALADLDDGDARAGKPLGALSVFWFIGTILVLAGSVMGVREAWRSLEGVFRPVVIASALFLYHVLFLGLARGLVRRSPATGRVLVGVASGLLPIVFVAAAVAIGQDRRIGVPFAGVLLVASAASSAFGGAVAFGRRAGAALAAGLVPALVLELLVGARADSETVRLAIALAAVAPVVAAATWARRAWGAPEAVALAAAAYGALAASVFALYGGPGDDALLLGVDRAADRALVAWIALAAAAAWWATSAPALAARAPRLAPVAGIVSLAALTGASLAAALLAFAGDAAPAWTSRLPLAVVGLATGVLVVEARTRRGALHVAVPTAIVAALLAGRALAPGQPVIATAVCGVVPAALLALGGARERARGAQPIARLAWGAASGAAVIVATAVVEGAAAPPPLPLVVTALVAAGLALAAHAGGRTSRPALHLAGALFAFVAVSAYALPSRPEPWPATIALTCAALALAYGLAALGYGAIAPSDDERRPLDDASLVLVLLGAAVAVLGAPAWAAPPPRVVRVDLAAAAPAIAVALVSLARSPRDRSALVVANGALALAAAAQVALGVATAGQGALVAGVLALAFVACASLRAPRPDGAPRFGRALLGLVPLPLGARGRGLLDGFAVAALALAAVACARAVAWLGPRPEEDRALVLTGLVAVVAALLAAFASRAAELLRARGSVVTLAAGGVVVALAAVSNRIGRPLAPAVVGYKLTLVLAALWIGARVLVRTGPRLGEALGRPEDGPRYHFVVHAGVAALAALLLVDALLVGAPTATRALVVVPPLLVAGGGLGAVLLHRSTGKEPLLYAGLLLLAAAAALALAQRGALGVALVPLDPPGGRWVPAATWRASAIDWLDPARFIAAPDTAARVWERAWLGLSLAAASLAAVAAAATRVPAARRGLRAVLAPAVAADEGADPPIARAFAVALVVAALVAAIGLASQPAVPAAAALVVCAVLALVAAAPAYRAIAFAVAAPVAVHALAQRGATVPPWAGPAFAAVALAVVVAGCAAARRARAPGVLAVTQALAVVYAAPAIAYALATGAPTSSLAAASSVIDAAARGVGACAWGASPSSAFALALLAAAAAVGATTWRGAVARFVAAAPVVVLAIAGAALAAFVGRAAGTDGLVVLVAREGALASAGIACAAAAGHVAAIVAARRARADLAWGFGVGRDAALVATTTTMAVFVAVRAPGGVAVPLAGVFALGVAAAVCVHAAATHATARHVALVEALLVAFYAFATRELALRPEVHALVGLGYGFSLLGVATIARRRGVPRVADATRRFVTALPIALALLTTDAIDTRAAALALGSSLLYGTMAWTERSRIYGSFAAIAANLALLVFAVAQGLDGVEVYVGPLGLLVTALAQIFAPKTSREVRTALRVVGGALLYLPAGVKLTLRLGAASSGAYAVVFGLVCLLGVAVGLVLRVRAYLALGTLFLTLDVVANLVHAGLRDHRVGFVLLSTAGLAILGGTILATIRREIARSALGRLRTRLRAWD